METELNKNISLLDEARLQADVLIPILNSLRKKIGAENSDWLVFGALRNKLQTYYQELSVRTDGNPKEKWTAMSSAMFTKIGSDIDIEWINTELESLTFNVKRCRYAELFREKGEPELGAVLMCELDNHIAQAAGPEIELVRRKTLMHGDTQCEFHYRIK